MLYSVQLHQMSSNLASIISRLHFSSGEFPRTSSNVKLAIKDGRRAIAGPISRISGAVIGQLSVN